jgi:putative phosphoserine phosphatase/1-acylglycerol-3-phosphate O-acyltransferase
MVADLEPNQAPTADEPAAPADLDALFQDQPRLRELARRLPSDGDWSRRPSIQMLARARQLKPDANARPTNPHRVAAFFDVDGTLIRGSIITGMCIKGIREGHSSLFQVVQFALCFLLYKLNLVPRATMYRWGYAPCRGRNLAEVVTFVDQCLEARVKPTVFKEAVETIASHRAAGHLCVAVTGAPDYAAAELCAYLGLHDILATPTPVSEDGQITNDVQEPICYADGKLAYLHAYAALHDVDLGKSYLYSDSASDIPVLKAVGRPRVVNPQWLLWPVAVLKRWPVTHWVTPLKGPPVLASSAASHPLDPT